MALACALPAQRNEPLSRDSIGELARLVSAHPDAPPISPRSIWRLLDQHALQPWRYQRWSFPRAPPCVEKAGRVLALDAGWWAGEPLGPDDEVISADEKTSIPARQRCHPTTPSLPGQPMQGAHDYDRGGALASLAAWDVRRGGVLGRCEATTSQAAFGRLVAQGMQPEP